MTDYKRSKNGETVHVADCPRAVNGVPWEYVDGMTLSRVDSTVSSRYWLRWCRVCDPRDPNASVSAAVGVVPEQEKEA